MPTTPKTPTKALAPNLYNTVGMPRRYVRGTGPRFDTENPFLSPTAVGALAPNLDPAGIAAMYKAGASFMWDPALTYGGVTRNNAIAIQPGQSPGAYSGVLAHEGMHYRQDKFLGGYPILAAKALGAGLGALMAPLARKPMRTEGIAGARNATGQVSRFEGAVTGGYAANELLPHMAGGGYEKMFGFKGNYQTLSNVPTPLKPIFKGWLR